jgi:hypothetical protein
MLSLYQLDARFMSHIPTYQYAPLSLMLLKVVKTKSGKPDSLLFVEGESVTKRQTVELEMVQGLGAGDYLLIGKAEWKNGLHTQKKLVTNLYAQGPPIEIKRAPCS